MQYGDIERTLVMDAAFQGGYIYERHGAFWITPIEELLRIKTRKTKKVKVTTETTVAPTQRFATMVNTQVGVKNCEGFKEKKITRVVAVDEDFSGYVWQNNKGKTVLPTIAPACLMGFKTAPFKDAVLPPIALGWGWIAPKFALYDPAWDV